MSSIKALIPLSLLGLCATHATSVMANDDIVPFIGLGGGYQWADDAEYPDSYPRGGIYNIYGGLQFTENWSWDLGYQYHNNLHAKATQIDVKTYLINTAIRYDWYLNQEISFFGRLGATYWNLDKNAPNIDKIDADGVSPMLETGVAYHFMENLALNISYQYVNSIGNDYSGEYDSHAAMMNLTYYFGSSDPAPVVVPPVVEQEQPVLPNYTITSNYGFEFASSEVAESLHDELSETAKGILQESPQQVEVVGHTDSVGSRAFNQKLSEQRAKSIADLLAENGIDPETVVVSGKGEDEPKASNDTAEGRAENRRVEIFLK